MSFPRLAAAEFLQALRWPGALGALLLVAGAGWFAGVQRPAQADLDEAEWKLQRAERLAEAVRSGRQAAPASAAQRRQQFYAALPAHGDLGREIERIYAAAASEQLSLLQAQYTGAEVPATGLERHRIVLPLKGSYAQVQRFVTAAGTSVPGLVLDDVSLQRASIADAQVDARLQVSLFVVKR